MSITRGCVTVARDGCGEKWAPSDTHLRRRLIVGDASALLCMYEAQPTTPPPSESTSVTVGPRNEPAAAELGQATLQWSVPVVASTNAMSAEPSSSNRSYLVGRRHGATGHGAKTTIDSGLEKLCYVNQSMTDLFQSDDLTSWDRLLEERRASHVRRRHDRSRPRQGVLGRVWRRQPGARAYPGDEVDRAASLRWRGSPPLRRWSLSRRRSRYVPWRPGFVYRLPSRV